MEIVKILLLANESSSWVRISQRKNEKLSLNEEKAKAKAKAKD